MNIEGSFGRLVRERRRLLDLTQEELARRVGCAAVTLRKIEADDLRPSQQIAERLAMSLGIPLEERASFVRLARSQHPDQAASTLPTPTPTPEEIGAEDLSGRAIRGYALGERIGAGGFGAVYRAVQPLVEREVAIKIILPQYANRPEFIRRFEAEAQLVARLEHPHIVPLYDYWREPGVAYLVMRLMRGGSVQALLQGSGPLPLESVSRILEQVGSALEAAHRAGIIHRDLKPANILLDEYGNAYLADFGIAKNLGNPNLDEQTRADEIIGSPSYFSPEQIRSETVKPQADIYSLGVVLYELLTGAKPFQGPTPIDLIQQHLTVPLPPLAAHRTGLPAVLDDIIARATAKNPLDRYTDVVNMVADVRSVVAGGPLTILGEATTLPELPEPENPYKGLRAFAEADALDFFGREALTQQLLARMAEGGDLARFLAVVGPSGSGKSSVVKAGLIPALRRGGLPGSENWFIVDFTPGAHPFEELEAALLRIAVKPPESLLGQLCADKRGLLRAVRRCLPDDPGVELVLVIDQFEEVFTLIQDESTRSLLLNSLVTAALDERSRVRIVLTLRADFTDRPLNYVDFGELMRQRMEIILPLTPDESEQAISGPARRAGLKLENGLDAAIIREVGDQPGALPLLQYALTELFVKREGRSLTRHAYAEIGGLLGALGRRAEEVFAGLDEGGKESARQMFLRLVTFGEGTEDTRRRVPRSELENLAASRQMSKVIESFGKARLLTFDRDPLTRAPTVEVAHEALLREWKRLHVWIESSRADVRMERQLASAAADWLVANSDPSFLLTGARLAQFEGWAATSAIALTANEQAFLDASLIHRRQQQADDFARQQHELAAAQKLAETEKQRAEEQSAAAKRLRRRAWQLTGAFVIALVLAILAIAFARTANTNLNAAQAANTQAVSERNRADQEKDTALAAQATSQAETYARATAEAAAKNQASLAFSRELAAGAVNNLGVDPERSVLLALQAISVNDTLEARNALHQALPELHILQKIKAHDSAVTGVAYSPDGRRIATSSSDKTAKVWDAATGQLLLTLSTDKDVWDVAFSPDGKILATSGFIDVIIWEAATGKKLFTLSGQTVGTTTGFDLGAGKLAFSPDGTRLAVANMDGVPKVWDIATQKVLLTLIGHTAIGKSIAYSPDGKYLATGTYNGEVKLWDAETGTEIRSLSGHTDIVHGLAFSPDGTRLASASEDTRLYLWDVATGKITLKLENISTSAFRDVVFTLDGKNVIGASYDGTAKIWDATSGRLLLTLAGHTSTNLALALSPDGQRLASGGIDQTLRLWDLGPGREVLTLLGHTASADGVAYSPDGARLVSAGTDGTVKVWDLASGKLLATLAGTPHPWSGIVYSADGKYLAAGSWDGVARVWEAATGREIITLAGHTNVVRAVSFNPDAKRLATASLDGTAKVWDISTGKELVTFIGHTHPEGTAQTNAVWGIAFSPDGKRIATGGFDEAVRVWDSISGDEVLTIPAEGRALIIPGVAFSPDGKMIASGQFNGLVLVWDAATGKLLHKFSGHSAAVTQVVFNADGTKLASASFDKLAKVWELATDQEFASLYGSGSNLMGVSFSPDGKHLATSGTDGAVHTYLLRFEDLIALAKSRLTRTLTVEECQKYLHQMACP